MKPIRMPSDLKTWGEFDSNLWWNVNTGRFSAGKVADSLEQWQESQGQNSVFADPQFVDPATRNYQVKSTSPALKLGFENFPMDQFGHRMTRIMNGSRDFSDTCQLTIRADARGGEIRYTLDGSNPTPDSTLYSTPLNIEATTTVRATTFDDQGNEVGFADTATLTKVENLKQQSWLASLLAGEFVAPEGMKQAVAESNKNSKPDSMEWSGMELVNISDYPDYIDASGGQASGVFATSVPEGSTAAKAGIKEGDTIIQLGQKTVRTLKDFKRGLKRASEKEVNIKVFRGYKHYDFTLAP